MSVEWEIHQRLTQDSATDTRSVAEAMVSAWRERGLSLKEKAQVASFLIHSGNKDLLVKLVIETLNAQEEVPWAQVALACADTVMPPEVADAMLTGAEQHNTVEALLEVKTLPDTSRIRIARHDSQEYQRELREGRKQQLLDKLQYLQSQRMFEEEGRALREFAKVFPNDATLSELTRSYDERWAREIISQKVNEPVHESTVLHVETKTPDQQKIEQSVTLSVEEAAAQHPSHAYDLAILLYFLDLFKPAQAVLARMNSTLATDWFGLELMLKGRQFVEALEEAQRLAKKYAPDPEASFAVIYARARALHGLGQTQTAIELMQSILQLRPNYRSAQVLLDDWAGSQS